MYQQFLFLKGVAHVSLTMSMFMTNSSLLWWTLNSATASTKPKDVKEALQWICERKCKGTSIKPNRQANWTYSASGVASPKFWGPKLLTLRRSTVFCLWHCFSKHKITRYAKCLGGHGPLAPLGCAYLQCNYFTRVEQRFRLKASDLEKTVNMNWLPSSLSVTTSARLHKWATHASAKSFPKSQFYSYCILNEWTWKPNCSLWIRNVKYKDFTTTASKT